MNHNLKQLFEITEIQSAKGKIEELDRFLDITRGFSLKCNGHLKILTNLVNNLVESDDWLELVETPLRLPPSKGKQKSVPASPRPEKAPGPTAVITASIQEDFLKISKQIETGKESSDCLKELLEKLLSSISNGGTTIQETKVETTTVNNCVHRHCHANCPPGCSVPHDNTHLHFKANHTSGSTRDSRAQSQPPPPRALAEEPKKRGAVHGPLSSNENEQPSFIGESHLELRPNASFDYTKRTRLSIKSDNRHLNIRTKENDYRSIVNSQQLKISKLEQELLESKASLHELQKEVLQMKLEKEQMEFNVRELISLPLVDLSILKEDTQFVSQLTEKDYGSATKESEIPSRYLDNSDVCRQLPGSYFSNEKLNSSRFANPPFDQA